MQDDVCSTLSERNAKLRVAYLACCERLGIKPCSDLVTTLSMNPLLSKNKKKFLSWRLSLCHANLHDDDFEAIIVALDSQGQGITELIFNHNFVTDQAVCKQLVPFLSKPGTVMRTLEMFGNKLGDQSCQNFCQVLQTNQTLLRLKLGDNCITTQGSKHLGDGLRHNQTLIQLHIGGNGIGDLGVIAIADALRDNTTLTSLGLRDNDIGVAGLRALTDLLALSHCQLAEVQLKGNKIGLDNACNVLAHALQCNNSLRVLELQSNQISAEGIACLAQALCHNSSIHAINLNDNALMDEGAEHVSFLLQQNRSITTVGLSGNSIAKRGASALWGALQHSNNSLVGIDLGNNSLGNAGAAGLAGVLRVNSTLESVDLNNNSIFSKGIAHLATALQTNSTLRHLDLGTNHGANEGTIALAKALSHNVSLTRLCLTDNEIHQEGGEALYQYLKNNTTLRNFNYGGQGNSANKIHPITRRQINSIITRNRRAWHTNNKATQEPAEDDEEDEILPELQTTRSESVFSDLGSAATPTPGRSPAKPQAHRPFQPRTPQRIKSDLNGATSTTWEAPSSPAPTPPLLPTHFQSLSHTPLSPGPVPTSATPTFLHPTRGQWQPSTHPSTPPPMASATPSPSIYPSSHMSNPLPVAFHSPPPPRQVLDAPMAGTELDLLPEPDGCRPTPLAFAPAPYRFPSYHTATVLSPNPSSCPSPTDVGDNQRRSFLPNISHTAMHHTPQAMFCHPLPPQLLSQMLASGPVAPPPGPPPFVGPGQPPLHTAGAKGTAGKGGFTTPQMRDQRSQPAARFSHPLQGPGSAESEDNVCLPDLSKYGAVGMGMQLEMGTGCQQPGKGAGGRKDTVAARPGVPFKPIPAATASASPFSPPGASSMLPSLPPPRGNRATAPNTTLLTRNQALPPASLTSGEPHRVHPWPSQAPSSHLPAQRPSRDPQLTPTSHSHQAQLRLVDWSSVTMTDATATGSCPPDGLPLGQPRSPRALTELLTRVLAATPSSGGCGEDACDGMPAPLLVGSNPFHTISQQFQGSSRAAPGAAALMFDKAPDLLHQTFRCLTHAADSAPQGGVGGDKKDSLTHSLLPRQADGHGGMAAPAALRVASAAAAAFPSSAVAAPPRDVHGYGGSVFAPRAVDFPTLRPNES
eukprot:GGOE01056190.1.p1 GENE.GGOE01056190.1~~GGOE01056190.1.p1  ORF type:complete len:1146 (-),score=202.57 GGOE01056190.1:174-3611(-)